MAIVTKGKDGNDSMADKDTAAEERDEREDREQADEAQQPQGREQALSKESAPGFFHIYKSGQGYWTRMGTAVGIGLVVFAIVAFLYERMQTWAVFQESDGTPKSWLILAVLGGLIAIVGIWMFRILNRPSVADFLIATDSEMKKVNWTTRKELIGSTKVVILFMFLIATILFVLDIFFGYFFYFINVLKFGPFAG